MNAGKAGDCQTTRYLSTYQLAPMDNVAEPSRAEPSRAEPSRAEPSRPSAEPSRAEPSRAEPSRAEPTAAADQLGPWGRQRKPKPLGRNRPRGESTSIGLCSASYSSALLHGLCTLQPGWTSAPIQRGRFLRAGGHRLGRGAERLSLILWPSLTVDERFRASLRHLGRRPRPNVSHRCPRVSRLPTNSLGEGCSRIVQPGEFVYGMTSYFHSLGPCRQGRVGLSRRRGPASAVGRGFLRGWKLLLAISLCRFELRSRLLLCRSRSHHCCPPSKGWTVSLVGIRRVEFCDTPIGSGACERLTPGLRLDANRVLFHVKRLRWGFTIH